MSLHVLKFGISDWVGPSSNVGWKRWESWFHGFGFFVCLVIKQTTIGGAFEQKNHPYLVK